MVVDPTVIAALKKALEADPQSQPIRLYLGSLLLYSGDNAAALEHFAQVLTRDPANVEALKGAAAAAAAVGESARTEGYRKLLLSLGAAPGMPAVSPPKESTVPHSEPEPRIRESVKGPADEENMDSAVDHELPKITLKDVGGMEDVKRRLNLAFLAPLRNPKMREVYGKSLRGGLLLYGPPGCGKTFIARATAGELGAHFYSVGLSDVLDMWMGQSERKLHEIFETARRNAPAVLFFDEIDALGHKRSQLRGQGGRNVVNTLLSEMDGMDSNNTGVFTLAATNHPWDVDAALRRPGRFDRIVMVLPPDEVARETILRHHLKDKPAETVDAKWIAHHTPEYSGADLAFLCESAAELAMEQSLESGRVRGLTTDDFKRALKESRSSIRAWFETAKNYALFANDGGMYDDLLAYMKAHHYT